VIVLEALQYRFSTQAPGEPLGRWLAKERRRMQLSQQSLCELAKLSHPTVIQIERGQGRVSSLVAIMRVLRLPLSLMPNEQEVTGADKPILSVHVGDCMEVLPRFRSKLFHTCITSPPYFRQRDYGMPGQIGLEPSADEYIARLVEVMRQVRRVLRNDGTLRLVIGDAFARNGS
jgi:transcriptional regulator with XRE-family HTH domain